MDQFTKLLSSLSLTQKISIVVIAIAAVAGIMAFSHWHHEGDFRPLYSEMAPEDAAAVRQKLRESGVEYRLADNGGTVLVSSQNLADSRLTLAQAGLPHTGRIGFELFDKSNFGATEFVEHVNYMRALEGELERSVMSLAEVEQARVHLTMPKESVFLDEQQPAKASVMVKLRPGARISGQNVQAVTNLVASAVQGLAPEAVSVVDMDGTLLSRPRRNDPDNALTGEALEMRAQIEKGLVNKINQTLEPLLGEAGFRAGASVDCDLTSGEQQEETLDPSKSVMSSSQKSEDLVERATASGGIPGTASTLPPASGVSPARPPVETSRRTENITYQTSRVVRHTKIPQGQIKRMSLAVLVDQQVRWEGQTRVFVPPPPETLKTIHDLVAAVTGLDADRGDQLIVETLPFETSVNARPPETANPRATPAPSNDPKWLQFANKYRAYWIPAGAGAALLLVLVVMFLMRRSGSKKKRRAEVERRLELASGAAAGEAKLEVSATGRLQPPPPAEPVLKEDSHELAERVKQMAKRDPQVTANVLRMWLQDSKS
ncbi:MAG TPA: flagellar basal-body MS-ring/collar protein FliF [Verrucomicrobiae bacterium]|nr:flagellar basal-body MS-ring/collar protein FliF [Verrucomicrobiae bacterium]